jgi:putative solute:sodium symporter small subunit
VDAGSARSADAKPRRQRFPFIALIAWALIAFGTPPIVQTLDAIKVLGFPLGFFMLAQGCIIAFLVIALLSALRRDALERKE